LFWPFILPGLIIAAILLFFGWFNCEGKPRLQFIVAGGLVLLLLGVYIAIDGVEAQIGEPYLIYTEEDSRYWNCTTVNASCQGVPETYSCLAYSEQQCYDIIGCNWTYSQGEYYCDGTPNVTCDWLAYYDPTGYKCLETWGCNLYWNETAGVCDWVNTTYYYNNLTYAYSEHDAANGWYSELLAAILVLTGLGVMLGIWDWLKTKDD